MKNYKKVWKSGITSDTARYTYSNVIDPSKETRCPHNYNFGHDHDEYVECDSCELCKECQAEWVSLNPPKKMQEVTSTVTER